MVALRRLASVLAVGGLLLAAPWRAHAAGDASVDDAARCIAVMQTNADDLARQIKAGDKGQELALHNELRRAGALIGRTYLNGLHDAAEAKARLKAAQESQSAWDESRRISVHQACLKQADAELAAASGLERYFAERFAQARFKRMLEVR